MRRRAVVSGGLCLLVATGFSARVAAGEASRSFQIQYRTVVKEIPPGAEKVEVWLPFPTSDAHQTISQVSIRAPYPVTISREPEYGNSILYVRVDHPTNAAIPIELTFTATRREYVHRTTDSRGPEPLSAAERARFLQPDKLVPIDGRIRQLAQAVTKGKRTDVEKARAIYNYVTRTVKYDKSGTGWGRGDALWVCDARHGNCTDFHSLIIGMARAEGLPAKFAIGFHLPAQRGSGEIPGYHCWAEVYTREAGWIPLDSSEASKHLEKMAYFFGAHDENRIQLSVGRDLTLNPKQAGEPLNYFVYPYVEVDGKAHAEIDSQFYFTDLPAGARAVAASAGR